MSIEIEDKRLLLNERDLLTHKLWLRVGEGHLVSLSRPSRTPSVTGVEDGGGTPAASLRNGKVLNSDKSFPNPCFRGRARLGVVYTACSLKKRRHSSVLNL